MKSTNSSLCEYERLNYMVQSDWVVIAYKNSGYRELMCRMTMMGISYR